MKQEEYLKYHEALCAETMAGLQEVDLKAPESAEERLINGILLARAFQGLCGEVRDFASGEFGGPIDRSVAIDMLWLSSLLAERTTAPAMSSFFSAGRALSVRKNNDYARPQDHAEDPYAIFKNFLQCEKLGICSVEAGFLVRLSDKVTRCCNLMSSGEAPAVVDEKLEDTLLDIVNYTCLLMAYIETKEQEAMKEGAK